MWYLFTKNFFTLGLIKIVIITMPPFLEWNRKIFNIKCECFRILQYDFNANKNEKP